MKFCTNCGNQLNDNALFCERCGTKAEVLTPTQSEQPKPEFKQPQPQVQPQPQFSQPQQNPQPTFAAAPVKNANNQNANYSQQAKSVYEIANEHQNQAQPNAVRPPYQPPQQNYNAPNQNYQMPNQGGYNPYQNAPAYNGFSGANVNVQTKKKGGAGKVILIVIGILFVITAIAGVVGMFNEKSLSEKVGSVSGNTYKNEYAGFTLTAPSENWNVQKGEDYYDALKGPNVKTDENGRKYVSNSGAAVYYETIMSYPDHGATAQVMILGLEDSSKGDLGDLKEGIVNGLTNSNSFYTLVKDEKETISGKEYEVKEYEGISGFFTIYEKVLIRDLDDKSTMVVIIMSIEKQDIDDIIKSIS